MKTLAIVLSGFFYCSNAFSQFQVRECDILYKKQFIRSVNLNNELNQQLFGKNNKIVKILTENFLAGALTGYATNELKDTLSPEKFKDKISVKVDDSTTTILQAEQLYIMELGENIIFDKQRSDVYFDMEFISILIPASVSNKGIFEHAVSFSFDDCVKIFRKNTEAVALNPLKKGSNINYAEVFMLRLFNSTIVKIGDPGDLYFDQQYNDPAKAFLARKNTENEISEYIYSLYHPR